MDDSFADQTIFRLAVFLGLLAFFAGLEALAPRRPRSQGPRRRLTNLAVSALDAVTLRLLAIALPALAVGAALDAQMNGFGLLNHLAAPAWFEFIAAVLIFDFAIWAQHLITHKVPFLWRFHRVHHSDRDFDVTTAIRFHPVEIAASMGLKIALVYLIGPSAWAMLAFEVLLSATALFNHANLRLAPGLDQVIRLVLVTPDMHRVHHSVHRAEHDSNFGFALSIWDRIFRTYRPKPEAGHEAMELGLQWQDDKPNQLGWAMLLPFRRR